MQQVVNDDWTVESITISMQKWGDYKGKYTGKIKFENKSEEAFMFNLRPEMCEEYLKLISQEVVGAASMLGERLLTSLKLLPNGDLIQLEEKK
jgi:hypothetical protein